MAGFVVFAIVNVVVVKHLGGASYRDGARAAGGLFEHADARARRCSPSYAYPAQIAAVILLVASVAAIILTLRQRTGGKPQDIAQQVAVRAKDRVRIVKMAAEKRP